MNLEKLKQAEADFFYRYPGGFDNPELIEIRKKHNLPRMFELAQISFAPRNFRHRDLIVENLLKVITRSSLVSVFEKAKFRNFAMALPPPGRAELAKGLQELLHGDRQVGFETLRGVLQGGKLGKWTLMTICPAYYHPQTAIFIKPTTTKRILGYFDLEGLPYHPLPTWAFYEQYRAAIDEMRSQVDASLSPYYIAFTGFLMRSMAGRLSWNLRSEDT